MKLRKSGLGLRKRVPASVPRDGAVYPTTPGRKRPGSCDASRLDVPDRNLAIKAGTAFAGPNRAARRRSEQQDARDARARARARRPAYFAGALDGKVHMLRQLDRTTSCGRQALLLDKTVNVHKNRCTTCAREMA